uniref:NADH-ubiquinone oxidoreductase chain 3 n=1 Tax=Schistosoma incognitum TaxID=198245 RepID=H9CWD7_9TREM|nr:NADH dehydrogenase subunit 3 [Schistosoma incognitum]
MSYIVSIIVIGVTIWLFICWYLSGINGIVNLDNSHYLDIDDWFSTFECGFISHGLSENFFSFSYINLLVFFIIFDLEVSLLLNVIYDGVWLYTFWCYFSFFMLILLGYIMEVAFGYVDWLD